MKKFGLYWKGNFKLAKDNFDITMLIVFGLLLVIAAICRFCHFTNPVEEFISEAKLESVAEAGAITFFSVWCFIWLPYKRHESDSAIVEQIRNDKMRSHDVKIFEAMNEKVDEGKLNSICYSIMTIRVVESEGLVLFRWLLGYGEKTETEFMMPSQDHC